MQNITVATSAFVNSRKDRPAEYYLTPLNDLIDDLANADGIKILVFTEPETVSKIKSAANVTILTPTLDEMMSTIWDEPHWRTKYHEILNKYNPSRRNVSIQAQYLNHIGIVVSKFYMIQYASELFPDNHVLWYDAGYRVSWHSSHDINKYKKVPLIPKNLLNLPNQLSPNQWGLFTVGRDMHGVDMKIFSQEEIGVCGCFLLIRNESISYFFNQVKLKWQHLMEQNCAGVEENALALLYWENKDNIRMLEHTEWDNLLTKRTSFKRIFL